MTEALHAAANTQFIDPAFMKKLSAADSASTWHLTAASRWTNVGDMILELDVAVIS